MRRRLREQRRVREALLLDLGALVYELHRQGRRAPELLQQKAAELTIVDDEVRELQRALDGSEEPAQETTEVEALAGDEPEEGALSEEPEEDGEREHDGELREDALDEELGEELGEKHERGDTAELGPEELAEGDEQLEEGDPEDGGREGEDSYDAPLAEREEPRA
jgi:hypothetical protein